VFNFRKKSSAENPEYIFSALQSGDADFFFRKLVEYGYLVKHDGQFGEKWEIAINKVNDSMWGKKRTPEHAYAFAAYFAYVIGKGEVKHKSLNSQIEFWAQDVNFTYPEQAVVLFKTLGWRILEKMSEEDMKRPKRERARNDSYRPNPQNNIVEPAVDQLRDLADKYQIGYTDIRKDARSVWKHLLMVLHPDQLEEGADDSDMKLLNNIWEEVPEELKKSAIFNLFLKRFS